MDVRVGRRLATRAHGSQLLLFSFPPASCSVARAGPSHPSCHIVPHSFGTVGSSCRAVPVRVTSGKAQSRLRYGRAVLVSCRSGYGPTYNRRCEVRCVAEPLRWNRDSEREESCTKWRRTPGQGSTGACITGGNARYGRRAAAMSSTAGIATTKPRPCWSVGLTSFFQDSLEVNICDRHEVPRHEIKLVICSLCNKEQDVQQDCSNCGTCLGKYFCAKCNFFDDDVSKNQFHCDGCGICRTGGAENFYHCDKCGCCYSYLLKDTHRCVDRAMHQNCPVCFEYLFDSTKAVSVLHCGHTIHLECLYEMRTHRQFSCPVCLRSACDMSDAWQKLDREVAASPMPAIYQKKMIWILCNDCGATSNVRFHILAYKCPACSSYNTRQTRGAPAACSRV